MKDYNGFSGSDRRRAQAWLNYQWNAGLLARPSECCACGQDKGIIDAHAEDYSQPFAAGKTDEFHLCYRCHMMVHCRFRADERWQWYKAQLRAGVRFEAFYSRNFAVFTAQNLRGEPPIELVGAPRDCVLSRIA
jgi:hypothetical protein